MVRTNLNSSLIILILLLIVTLSAGFHYQLKAERTKLEKQFVRLDNYDESVMERVDFLQELQKGLLSNLDEFNGIFTNYQNSLTQLRADSNLLNVDIQKLTSNVACLETENQQKMLENNDQIITLQKIIYSLQVEQDANLNVLNGNLSKLENLLEQNEMEFTDFISKFGTRKMKKNLQTIETEEATLELTNN